MTTPASHRPTVSNTAKGRSRAGRPVGSNGRPCAAYASRFLHPWPEGLAPL